MFTTEQAAQLYGKNLVDAEGTKVGTVGLVYIDDQTAQPEWVTVRTGLFGSHETFVPLQQATDEGDVLRVPYSKEQIKDAPRVDPAGDGSLPESEETRLYAHYNVELPTQRTSDLPAGMAEPSVADMSSAQMPSQAPAEAVGYDTSGPTTDSAMTRSEEVLHAGTERVATGRARLRKWVETEHVNVEVPVTRERARLVTEPVDESNIGQAMDGPTLSDEEHEVILTEERPVIAKETVPVERVRLEKDVEASTASVGTDVSKERIAAEGDVAGAPRTGLADAAEDEPGPLP